MILRRFLIIFLLCTGSFSLLAHEDVTPIPSDIKQLFPSATRVGSLDAKLAVTPVYQLSELLGYVFESDDFTHFIGFSGQTINVLIALDPQGILINLKVLNHHEPIFLHGLGEQPMNRFIKQYQGHSIKERFVIGARSKDSNDSTYFDGVTKATVSVLVLNDTIISSALKVARTMLDGFTASASRAIKPDFFEPLGLAQLVSQGYISHWQLSKETALQQRPELELVLDELADDLPFVDMYLAFVNIPMVGRNLLGDDEYQRLLSELKPGEHALMFFNRGSYSFIDDEFVPQTVPSRLKVAQGDFPVDLRDIDFYSYFDRSFALDLSQFEQIKIFRIKSQSGFELSQTVDLSLGIRYSQSFLSQKQHWFNLQQSLPDQLFELAVIEQSTEPQPLWQRIWLGRQLEIVIVAAYLLLVLALFIQPSRWAANALVMAKLRLFSLIFVVGFIGVYAQGQLSVVNIYTLLLSLKQGFNLEVFLLDPIIFMLWLVVFVSLFVWGRGLFCGWLCPFGAMQELIAMVAAKFKIKQIRIKPAHHNRAQKIKYLLLIGLVASAFYSLTLAEQLAEIEPFKTSVTLLFDRYWPFVLYALVLLGLSLKIHKFYCRYLCPLGAGLAIVGAFPWLKWIPRRVECGSPCQLCRNKKCGIDAIKQTGAINYGECIGCFECVVTIEDPAVCVINKYANKQRKTASGCNVKSSPVVISL